MRFTKALARAEHLETCRVAIDLRLRYRKAVDQIGGKRYEVRLRNLRNGWSRTEPPGHRSKRLMQPPSIQ